MANIVPSGIDQTNGQRRAIDSTDTLTNSDGSSIFSTTASGIGTRILTMSGNVVLTDSDEAIQSLTTSVARTVTLPAITTSTPQFTVINDPDSTAILTLLNSSGAPLIHIGVDQTARVETDGTQAYATIMSKVGASTTAQNVYYWGVTSAIGGPFYMGVNSGSVFTILNAANSPDLEQVVAEAGTVTEISISGSATAIVYEIWLNGSLDTTLTSTASVDETQTVSIAVVAGDLLAIRKVTNTSSTTSIKLVSTTTATPTSSFNYTGDITAALRWIGTYSNTITTGATSYIVRDVNVADGDGFIRSVGWSAETTGAVCDIQVNGFVRGTVTLSTAQGSTILATPIPIYAGDTVACYISSGFPDQVNINLYASSPGTSVMFGGNALLGRYLLAGRTTASTTVVSIDASSSYAVTNASRLYAFAVASTTLDGIVIPSIGIWRNGTQIGSEALSQNTTQYIVATDYYGFAIDDVLSISTNSTIGETSVRAIFR